MASTHNSDEEVFASLADSSVEGQLGIGDLSRMSVEAFMARQHGPSVVRSHGKIRLAGEGVQAHSARMAAVGAVMQELQRLVSTVGSAIEGSRSTRGRISESILRKTLLEINAAPAPGSIVISFAPKFFEGGESIEERPLFGDEPAPLADRSLETVIELFRTAVDSGPEADSFAFQLNELGPRTAGAVADLVETIADDDFDMTLTWAEPRTPTEHVEVHSEQARWMKSIIESRRLDETPVEILGILKTISDRRAIEVETADGEVVSIKPGETVPPILEELTLHSYVRVDASEKIRRGPGGVESRSLTLLGLDLA